MNLNNIPEPLNAQERLLYAIVVRQNILIEQLSSIVEHIAKKDEVAVTSGKVVSAEETTDEAVEEKPKRAPRKRTTKE